MAEEDNESTVSSLVGSVVGAISDNSKIIIEKGRIENLKATLARDAAAKTVLNGGYSGEDVIKSPHIEHMLDAYRVASSGRVIVLCAPADSGKTRAAEFFIHGSHPFRPDRSLMVSAAAMEDFAGEFSSALGVADMGPNFGEFLCSSLSQNPKMSSSAAKLAAEAGDVVDTAWCIMQDKRSFDESNEIKMYGPAKIPSTDFTGKGLPMLIIDNFNEASDKNKAFVTKLFQEASQYGVFVFILTSNETWATTLVGLNGGSKIKPLHGNVNNADYEITRHFQGVPDWNTLSWPTETLRELIRPICDKHGVDPAAVVPDGARKSPVEANDAALHMVFQLSMEMGS